MFHYWMINISIRNGKRHLLIVQWPRCLAAASRNKSNSSSLRLHLAVAEDPKWLTPLARVGHMLRPQNSPPLPIVRIPGGYEGLVRTKQPCPAGATSLAIHVTANFPLAMPGRGMSLLLILFFLSSNWTMLCSLAGFSVIHIVFPCYLLALWDSIIM